MNTNLKKIYLWPIWLIQVLTWNKSFRTNPVIGSYWLNVLGLHVFRLVLSHLLFNFRLFCLSPLVSKQDRKQFREQGYLIVKDFLNAEDFLVLTKEVGFYNGNYRELKEGSTATRRVYLSGEKLAEMPTLKKLTQMPKLLKLIRYTSSKNRWPLFYIENLIHGKNAAELFDPQKQLHSDTFHPTVKAWLFVDCVSNQNGPFNYVPKSHLLSWSRIKWEYHQSILASDQRVQLSEQRYWDGSFRVSEQDLLEMGYQQPTSLEVPANTLVIANTHGFHRRGDAPEGQSRMAIWMQCRDNPFIPFFTLSPSISAKLFDIYWRKKQKELDLNLQHSGNLQLKSGGIKHG